MCASLVPFHVSFSFTIYLFQAAFWAQMSQLVLLTTKLDQTLQICDRIFLKKRALTSWAHRVSRNLESKKLADQMRAHDEASRVNENACFSWSHCEWNHLIRSLKSQGCSSIAAQSTQASTHVLLWYFFSWQTLHSSLLIMTTLVVAFFPQDDFQYNHRDAAWECL